MRNSKRLCVIVALFALAAPSARAAALIGQWQGKFRAGDMEYRQVLQFFGDATHPQCRVFVLDVPPPIEEQRCSALTIDGSAIQFSTETGYAYKGALSPDGDHIAGAYVSPPPIPIDFSRTSPSDLWTVDAAAHRVSFVPTSDGYSLEVLNYGGDGPPLLLLAGLNFTAHVFDGFAGRLTAHHHVYAFSRRGFGGSSRPEPYTENYTTERLGEDVYEVVQALKLERPVIAGWSLAGQELSWMGVRHPDRVRGLVYLDAAYSYSFYAPGNLIGSQNGNVTLDANDLRRKMIALKDDLSPKDGLAAVDHMLQTDLPQLQADLQAMREEYKRRLDSHAATSPPLEMNLKNRINYAVIWSADQKYPVPAAPVLAIYATEQPLGPNASEADKTARAQLNAAQTALIQRFRKAEPKARVVEVKGAQHAVFLSNPDLVAREMEAFMAGLP